MKVIYVIFSLSITSAATFAQTWTSLCNGRNLDGWQRAGESAPFSVADGSIVMHQKANTKVHSFIHTNEKYKDFILEFEAKRDASYHYGVLFRAKTATVTAKVSLLGYQIKVDHDKKRRWTGGIFDDFGDTWQWLYPLTDNQPAQAALKPPGAWDHYRIEAIGNKIRVWLNNVETVNMQNDKYDEGYVALKIHFLGDNPEREKFAGEIRNMKILTSELEQYSRPMTLPVKIVD